MENKKDVFEKELAECQEVSILVREAPGLLLPAHVMPVDKPTVLVYGLDMAIPIDDLEVTDEGISATLSFQRTPMPTFVPWDAVVAIQGNKPRPRQRAKLRSV